MTHPKKFLENGAINPLWKPRASGAHPKKFLENGDINPLWKPRTSGAHPKKILESGEVNTSYKKRKGGKDKSIFERAKFIGWDGEGVDTGREINGAREQFYTLLANSLGEEIEDPKGLSTKACLDFICKTAQENKKGIHVIFGGSYDANMILRDLSKEKIERIADDKNLNGADYLNYRIRYTQRKYLEIHRFRDVKHRFKYDKKIGQYVPDYDVKIILWDVFGFFQTGFIGACEKWLGKGHPLYSLIQEGKNKRNVFTAEDAEFIKKYNRAELDALVEIMRELQRNIAKMGLTITRWDGAGAIASAMFKKHDVKAAFCHRIGQKWVRVELPKAVQDAAQYAYFGGRIEVGRIGRYTGKIYHYDINSAYPSAQYDLPALTCGSWRRRGAIVGNVALNSLQKMSVCLVEWNFPGAIWGAFPYRSEMQKKVLFPEQGINWIWLPEVLAGAQLAQKNKKYSLKILDCYEFIPDETCFKPYMFMKDYYVLRQEMVKETKEKGVPHGEEKIIKLGLNSGYGKTAQHAGYHPDTKRKPPFHNLAYAGYITSATRAKLYLAAMQKPGAIICIATDGIFSTEPLELDCPKEKILGAWEKETHDEIILVQSGFYYYRNGEKWVCWTRGFDKIQPGDDYQKQVKKQIEVILNGWRSKVEKIYFPCTRFITMKSAIRGENWWSRWCGWYSLGSADGLPGRALDLCQNGTKRILVERYAEKQCKPDERLISTIPEINFYPKLMSKKYALPWEMDEELLDGVPVKVIEEEMEVE